MIVVSAAIVDRANKKLLLAQRGPKCGKDTSYAFAWCTPGGKVEEVGGVRETHRDALARELREELGLEFRGGLIRLVYDHKVESTRTGKMVTVYCYEIAASDCENVLSCVCGDGTIGVGWFDADEVMTRKMPPADDANRRVLASLLL